MIKTPLRRLLCIGLVGALIVMPHLMWGQDDFIGYQLLERIPQKILKGKLILSDSPEEVKVQGILYEEEVNGLGRLLFHHMNSSNIPKHFVILLRNKEASLNNISILKREIVGPTKYIVQAGKTLLEQYFNDEGKEEIQLAPDEEKILFISDAALWQPHSLLTGIMDFETSGKVEIITAAILPNTSITEIKNLPYLERDRHPRGTFSNLEETYKLHLPSFGKYYMCMEQEEDWAIGKDGITQEITMNRGNYGIMYHITIQAEATTKVQIVPRAGVFKGVIKWDDGKLIPIERTHYFKHCKEPVDIGMLRAGETRTLSYMLPNGSAAPVWLQFEVLNE